MSASVKFLVLCLLAFGLAACASAPQPSMSVYDPDQVSNRKVHAFNKSLDRGLVGPVASGYGAIVPEPVDTAVSNFAEHLSVPGEMVNSLLQFRLDDVVLNTVRFTANTVFGLGGLYDFATAVGIPEVETDFGETLYVWGVPEGRYVELPVFGAHTERAAWGLVVDIFMDPLTHLLPPGSARVTTPAYVIDKVGDRHQYDSVINGILYESEDSYVAQRSIYLQNRRFKLSGGRDAAENDDLLDDLFGDE